MLKVKAKVTQSCLTLCEPMDYMIHDILQARILEWVAFPFSRGSSWPRDWSQVFHIAGGILYQLSHKEALMLRMVQSSQMGWLFQWFMGNW